MHHHFFTLRSHSDIAKFELEDGVVRTAAAGLLAEESTISHLLVDMSTERTLALTSEVTAPQWESSIVVSSADESDANADVLGALVVDVASIIDHWTVMMIEVSDLDGSWVGSATPGPKMSFVVRRSSGIDSASFNGWLRDTLSDAVAKSPGMGTRAIAPLDADGQTPRDSILSFWFSDEAALNDAVSNQLFAPLLGAELIEADSVRSWSTVEHRLTPNPNAWSMPTGRLMPEREIDEDA